MFNKYLIISLIGIFLITTVHAKEINSKGEPLVTGVVTDAASKKPVAEVTITAIHLTTKAEHQISTDTNGSFKINQLPNGNYKLKFEKNNYKTIEKNNVAIKQDNTTKVNIEIVSEKVEESYESIIWQLRFGM